MIELYSGTPGSGKSLHAAKEIRTRLRMPGRIILGNFCINTKAVRRCRGTYLFVPNHRLLPERLLQFSRRLSRRLGRCLKEGEILLLIDEAQLLFNSREWQNVSRHGWLSFFSQHRHYGYDIILAAQFDRMLDRQIRSLIEYEQVHRKVSRFGYAGFFLGLLTNNSLYVAVKRWYPVKQTVESNFFLGHKGLYRIYDSYHHFDALPDTPRKRMSGEKRGPAIAFPALPALPPQAGTEKEDAETQAALADAGTLEPAIPPASLSAACLASRLPPST